MAATPIRPPRPGARPKDLVARERVRAEIDATRGDERVLAGLSKLRAEAAYEAAGHCAACEQARARDGMDDALCDAHMEQALGMHSEWDAIRRR